MLSAQPVPVLHDEGASQSSGQQQGKQSNKPVRKGLSVITNSSNVPRSAATGAKAAAAGSGKNASSSRPRRALGNITNVDKQTTSTSEKMEAPHKPTLQTSAPKAIAAPAESLPSVVHHAPESPERLMGLSGKELEALQEKEEQKQCAAHADLLASLCLAARKPSPPWSPPSYEAVQPWEPEDEAELSPLPERTPSQDELPDLPDWFFPLTFELD